MHFTGQEFLARALERCVNFEHSRSGKKPGCGSDLSLTDPFPHLERAHNLEPLPFRPQIGYERGNINAGQGSLFPDGDLPGKKGMGHLMSPVPEFPLL